MPPSLPLPLPPSVAVSDGSSRVLAAEAMRADAALALAAGAFGVLVMGMHASGHPREATALAMAGATIGTVAAAVRLANASSELARAVEQAAPPAAADPAVALVGLAGHVGRGRVHARALSAPSCPYQPGAYLDELPPI